MDDGVNGEHGVHVPRRVVEVRGHDIDHVTIQHLQMVVPIALESSLRWHNVIYQHAQVFMLLLSVFLLLH